MNNFVEKTKKKIKIKSLELVKDVWTSPKNGSTFSVLKVTTEGNNDQTINNFFKSTDNPVFNNDDIGKEVEVIIWVTEKNGFTNYNFETQEQADKRSTGNFGESKTIELLKVIDEKLDKLLNLSKVNERISDEGDTPLHGDEGPTTYHDKDGYEIGEGDVSEPKEPPKINPDDIPF